MSADKPKNWEPSDLFQEALQVLQNIEQAGYALLPLEASLQMIEAGARAGQVERQIAAAIWKAMVQAATTDHGPGLRDPAGLLQQLSIVPPKN